MPFSTLTDHDYAALSEAAALVNDVISRHPMEMTGPILTKLQMIVHGIADVERLFEAREELSTQPLRRAA